jgi:hypothetical protein
MKNIIKKLLREHLLLEGKAYPYQETEKSDYGVKYEFTADNIPYIVTLVTDKQKETYELGFNVADAESVAHRTKKDLTHLNNVLATLDDIVKDAVHKYRIKKIVFSGAREQSDSDIPFIDPLRLKAYLRYLTQHHPNANIDKDRLGNAVIFMNSIYPEVFEQNKDDKEKLLDLLKIISDENPNDWRFDNNFEINQYDNKLQGETDAIENSKHGAARIEINYFDNYEVEIEFYDSDEIFNKEFKNFDKLLEYVKHVFLNQ